MKTSKEVEDKFFAGQASDKTKFGVKEGVSVLCGLHQGARGSVISILSVDPKTMCLIELEDGSHPELDKADLTRL